MPNGVVGFSESGCNWRKFNLTHREVLTKGKLVFPLTKYECFPNTTAVPPTVPPPTPGNYICIYRSLCTHRNFSHVTFCTQNLINLKSDSDSDLELIYSA